MTTALLREIHKQDQEKLADRHNGEAKRQPRRVWAAEALKPELSEGEWKAAIRAVRECILWFPGAKPNLDRVDMAWNDVALAGQMDAGRALFGLRQGVAKRCAYRQAPNCAEWLVQLHTLEDIAKELGHYRRMGPNREPIPDIRPARPFVRIVLMAMARYYEDCDVGREKWCAPT